MYLSDLKCQKLSCQLLASQGIKTKMLRLHIRWYSYIVYSFLLSLDAFGVWIAVVISWISELPVVAYMCLGFFKVGFYFCPIYYSILSSERSCC